MKKTIRMKEVTLDGASFTIAALSFKQQRALHEAQLKRRNQIAEQNAGKTDGAATEGEIIKRTHPFENESFKIMIEFVICPSLNRAMSEETPETEKWNTERAEDELDFQTLDLLLDAILDFSGLTVIAKNKDAETVPLAENQESQKPTLVT